MKSIPLYIIVVLFGVLGFATPGEAGGTSEVSLDYTRGPGASECLDEAQLRQEVAARLGSSPFDRTAERSVRVSVSAGEGQGLQARIVVERPGHAPRVRQLADPDTSCQELGEAVVFAVSVAIDPGRALGGAKPPPTNFAATFEAARTARIAATARAEERAQAAAEADSEPTEPLEPTEQPGSTEPASSSLAPDAISGLVGGGVALGSAPGAVGSFSLGTEFGWDGFSVQPGLRVDLPGSEVERGARVEATITMGEFAGCGRIEPIIACGVVAAGVLRGSGVGLAENRKVSAFHAAAGARLGADIGVYGPMSLRLQGEVLAPLNRTTLVVNLEPVWQTPALSAQLGALVVLEFL